MNTDNKTAVINFRTTEELKQKLELMAKKENRSLSNMIEVLLELAVKKENTKK